MWKLALLTLLLLVSSEQKNNALHMAPFSTKNHPN